VSAATAIGAPGPPGALARWLAFLAATFGSASWVLTMSVSGAALPYMQGAFSAAPDQMAWVLTSFVIGTTIATACSGWMATRFGRKEFYLLAVGGFTLSTLLCGFATSLEEAVVYRTLQGVFSAPLAPVGQAIIFDCFPPEKRGFAVGIWSLGSVSGALFGPYLGGMLVEAYGWPWLYFLTVPASALAFIMCWFFVPKVPRQTDRKFSWIGFGAVSVAITGFQLALNRGERLDWFESTEIVAALAVATVALYVFVTHTALARRPFVDRGLFRDRNYVIGSALIFVFGALNFLQMFMMPVLLQTLGGYTIVDAGYFLGWRAAGLIVSMLVFAPFVDKLDVRLTFVIGFLFMVVSAWGMSIWTLDILAEDVAWTIFLQGVCSGIAYITSSMMAYSTLPRRLHDDGAAMFFLMMALGTATGTAAIFNVLTRSIKVNYETLSGLVSVYSDVFRHGAATLPGRTGGIAAIDAEVLRQSAMIAYNNSFLLIAVITAAILPLALFVRMPRSENTER